VVILVLQRWILERAQLPSAAGLWITMVAVLMSIWMYMFWGVLQGRQTFLWLGWSMISNGVGRVVGAVVAIVIIRRLAVGNWFSAGMMAGVTLGVTLATGIAIWQSRAAWSVPPERFDWRSLARQVVPLLLAFFGFQILFTADTLFVGTYFPNETTAFYVSAGTLSRALMWLVGPLAAVLFPRLVHSAVKGEKQNLTALVLVGTGILAGVGALGMSLLGPLLVKIVFRASFVKMVPPLLPWYAGAMVPLSMANVLLNNLMAKPSSKASLAVCVFALAIGYCVALTQFHKELIQVLQVVCLANGLLLLICCWFTWRGSREVVPAGATV
jgi:O-antigen/teichoic acid export membrane protein